MTIRCVSCECFIVAVKSLFIKLPIIGTSKKMVLMLNFCLHVADILRANDDLAKVIEDYRRIVGVPGEPKSTLPSATSSTAPNMAKPADHSSNLSSLIDLDMSDNTQTSSSANGDILSGDLQNLGG